jgi:hypothetical protein
MHLLNDFPVEAQQYQEVSGVGSVEIKFSANNPGSSNRGLPSP